jgi:hypothetical protein
LDTGSTNRFLTQVVSGAWTYLGVDRGDNVTPRSVGLHARLQLRINNPALKSSETKEGQYSYDNDHQAHNVDDIVHRFVLTDLKESNRLFGHWFQGFRRIPPMLSAAPLSP